MTHTPAPPPGRPLPARLIAWMHERFPLENAVLFVVLYVAALSVGRALTTTGEVLWTAMDAAAFLATWCFFLMLRVFDEHKDYELDCHNHPDRVLQSGQITLGHLKVLGVLAVLTQVGFSIALDQGLGPITMTWAVVMTWSALMAVEFFCGEWLEKRLVLYALSHMLVMPMALIWMAQIGAGQAPLPMTVGTLAALSFLSGAAFEVTRKLRAPEDERDTIDSYTKVLGTTRAPVVVMALLALGTGTLTVLLDTLMAEAVGPIWLGALIAVMLPALVSLQGFRSTPSAKAAKRCEGMVALCMLSGYVIMLVAIGLERGFGWQ